MRLAVNTPLALTRFSKSDDGIFSHLFDADKNLIAFTLEHAYDREPKIPNGTYKCVRATHHLPWHQDEIDPRFEALGAKLVTIEDKLYIEFETFEVTGVEGHEGLLLHWGCYNRDSNGCALLGDGVQEVMLTNSRATFAKFMTEMSGVNEFDLVVS